MREVRKRADPKAPAGVESRWTSSSNLFSCVNEKTRLLVQAGLLGLCVFGSGSCVTPTNQCTPEASRTRFLLQTVSLCLLVSLTQTRRTHTHPTRTFVKTIGLRVITVEKRGQQRLTNTAE